MIKLSSLVFTTLSLFYMNSGAKEIQILSAVKKDTPIANAEVIFQKTGETSVKMVSNEQGKVFYGGYRGIDASDTMMLIKKPGFSTLVAKCPCDGLTYALSPNMQNLDSLRVVLTWGHNPVDLDSHLSYPQNHIFFGSQVGSQANLDVDDTDSFGPETITIEKKQVGKKYIYAVHNYSENSNPTSSRLSSSGATVNVYIGQTLVRTYYTIPHHIGNIWVVFGIDENGIFHDINSYIGTSDNSEGVKNILTGMLSMSNFQTSNSFSRSDLSQAEILNKQGEQQYHRGNLESAMYLYQDAINISSSYGQAYSNLGLTYQKLGREAEALWANRKAIELANGSTKNTVQASSYYNIAKIYESRSQWQDALNNYRNALSKKEHPAYRQGIARMQAKLH
ncbi:MAG TPA: hypothetical protein CFH83_04545 [Sulfuricurvum kujiense]|uniref:Uncharacterized protein n=1 Tax=Sulfuricurvum kujiense TaxID=148813 RepID=A0A2D3WE55_9BACT|nr:MULTISPECIES: tetratricopeptide repeat protein [Sulfuricurvum]OHD91744.1 MAG: hypothetical protein A2517_11130 [Sulfuricurvum sp. RIFOXYD12_FULL_44_77]DAB38718.1 MAG TPA: hypothetical protein CFH83_04545 [Sulfuricurvum kujiense]